MGNNHSRDRKPHPIEENSRLKEVEDVIGTSTGKQELDIYQQIGEDIIINGKYLALWNICDTDKEVLRTSWAIIVKDCDKIGVVMFLKMFETHPETLSSFIHDVYSIKELEMGEWYQEKLKEHSIRVMSVVGKIMNRLHQPSCTASAKILIHRGLIHRDLGVQRTMLEKMGRSFVVSIQEPLQDVKSWDASVEKAWLSLFRFIEFWMGLSYIEVDKIHMTLEEIKEDPRLPGGQIDTEYVKGKSAGGVKSSREVLAEMMAGEPETTLDIVNDKTEVKESLPQCKSM